MKKINENSMLLIVGGTDLPTLDRCMLWSLLFTPIAAGCIAKEIDRLIGS